MSCETQCWPHPPEAPCGFMVDTRVSKRLPYLNLRVEVYTIKLYTWSLWALEPSPTAKYRPTASSNEACICILILWVMGG